MNKINVYKSSAKVKSIPTAKEKIALKYAGTQVAVAKRMRMGSGAVFTGVETPEQVVEDAGDDVEGYLTRSIEKMLEKLL